MFADPAVRRPFAPDIPWHVGKKQVFFCRMPDGTFGEDETGSDLVDRRVRVHQVQKFGIDCCVAHELLPNNPV